MRGLSISLCSAPLFPAFSWRRSFDGKGSCSHLLICAASSLASHIFKFSLLSNDLSLTGIPYVVMFFICSLIKVKYTLSVSDSIKRNWTDWPQCSSKRFTGLSCPCRMTCHLLRQNLLEERWNKMPGCITKIRSRCVSFCSKLFSSLSVIPSAAKLDSLCFHEESDFSFCCSLDVDEWYFP